MARASWFVPGRIELLGKHVDYLGGRSLTCATPWGLTVSATRHEGAGRLLGVDDVYARAVMRRVARDLGELRFDAEIGVTSTLPAGAGMSSSSAYVLGLLMALVWANDLSGRSAWRGAGLWRPLAFAEYAAAIEGGTAWGPFAGDDGVGTRGGAQDHVAIVGAMPVRVGQYAYLPAREEALVRWPADWRIVVMHSGVVAEKTGAALADYNRVAAEGRAGGAARRGQFSRECEVLVPAASAAIEAGDAQALGEAVAESQYLAETVLQNQVPPIVALVKAALGAGAFAASSFGAGFGGAVWAAVAAHDADAVVRAASVLTGPGVWAGVMVPERGMSAG